MPKTPWQVATWQAGKPLYNLGVSKHSILSALRALYTVVKVSN